MATYEEPRSVLDHLGELKQKLWIVVLTFIGTSIVAHIFHEHIIAFLLRPIGDQHLIFLSPLEPIFFILKIDCATGLIASFPVIVWAFLSYIAPALPKRIASLFIFFCMTSTLLLLAGLLYAFFVTIPISLKFLTSINIPGIENQISVQHYLSFFITQTIIIVGIFQVPIVLIGGMYLRAFSPRTLARKRRIIYIVITIALAVLTPTTDIFSLIIVLIPCLAIFEVSLLGGVIMQYLRKRKISQ